MEKKVLIVDDEEDIGLMVSSFVKKAGMLPTYLNRVAPAETEIVEKHFDYYFLDLNLPDGTGFDLIPLIKEHNPKAIIVIISAYDSDRETSRAKELGVAAFLKKPFTKNALLETLEQ